MSGDLKELFDAFYERFVLRDLFGKIVPGLIVLLTIGSVSNGTVHFMGLINSLSVGAWIALIGMAWLQGFAVQSLGEFLHLIIYYPANNCLFRCAIRNDTHPWTNILEEIRDIGDLERLRARLAQARFGSDAESYAFSFPVRSQLDEKERKQVERLVVIKEACGNGYVAILISLLILLAAHLLIQPYALSTIAIGSVVMIVNAFFLARMHFVHVRRQHEVMAQGIKSNLWQR